MNNICKLLIGMMAAVCCTSCNNEWEDEQFKQLASFKAEINNEGVTCTLHTRRSGDVTASDFVEWFNHEYTGKNYSCST